MEAKDIEVLQARLVRDRRRILRGNTRTVTKAKGSGDIADKASDISEDLVRSSLSSNDVRTLRDIEQAMKRIEKGSYGICESCNEEISMRRLRILPYATRCIGCESGAAKQSDLIAGNT